MAELRDEGIVLGAKPYSETSAIAEVFTRLHGRVTGVIRGGVSRRIAPHLEPGTGVALVWHARSDAQMPSMTVEPLRSRAFVLSDRHALAALSSICALLQLSLPDRLEHRQLWQETDRVLDQLLRADCAALLLGWEMLLLQELGFGLDLTSCAVTGGTDDLTWVSPKTGRAVSAIGAKGWEERLLPLPAGLSAGLSNHDSLDRLPRPAILQGFALTGHFLGREIAAMNGGRELPVARARFLDLLSRQTP